MSGVDDTQLLKKWAHEETEEAFAELAHRHMLLVWSTARRITGDPDLARDIAQTVFSDLAHKAGVLSPTTFLPGWLHRATVHTASKWVRGNMRRIEREQHALTQLDVTTDDAEGQIALALQPLLDDALAALPDSDRDAVLLRFFGGKSYEEIGAVVGSNGDTVQKRVSRAIAKLRDHFQHCGVPVTAGLVAASLNLAGSVPMPAGLINGITAALLGPPATTTPAFGLFCMKTTIACLAVATGILGAMVVKQHQQIDALASVAANAIPAPSSNPNAGTLNQAMLTELLRLRAEVARRKEATPNPQAGLVTRLQGQVADQAAQLEKFDAEVEYHRQIVQRLNALKELGFAARTYAREHNNQLPISFDMMGPDLVERLDSTGNLPGGISPDEFEFFPQPRAFMPEEHHLILFREKKSLPNPTGNDTHVYCLADGGVRQVNTSESADFEWVGTAVDPLLIKADK